MGKTSSWSSDWFAPPLSQYQLVLIEEPHGALLETQLPNLWKLEIYLPAGLLANWHLQGGNIEGYIGYIRYYEIWGFKLHFNIWGQYHHETAHMTLPPTAALRVCALLLVITCMGGGWILEQPRSSQLIWLPRVRATFRMLPKVWGHA